MKKNLSVFIAGLCLAVSVNVSNLLAGGSEPTKVEVVSKILSNSIDENGVVLNGGPVLETSFTVSAPSGAYLSLTSSRGIDGRRPSTESRDYLYTFLGWERELGNFSADGGMAYYDYASFGKDKKNGISSLYLEVKRKSSDPKGLEPFVNIQGLFMGPKADYEGGSRVGAGARQTLELGHEVTFKHSVTALYEDGAFGYKKSLMATYGTELSWSRGGINIILPSITVCQPVKGHDQQKTNITIGGGIKINF